ncbi:uncharacterized protein LOC142533791 [Primulina tabacum]|uniref:uncharacterized protein LOC142533791 n=1 Tax=Primulina tabacum TaxID=48773 RepID=UPI003F5ACBBE
MLPPRDPGRPTTPPEPPPHGDLTVQVSVQMESDFPSNKPIEILSSPMISSPPAYTSSPGAGCVSSEASLSALSIAPHARPSFLPHRPQSAVESPSSLFMPTLSGFLPIPAVSGHLFSSEATIWNPPSQTNISPHVLAPMTFSGDGNFRSTFPIHCSLAASSSLSNYSAVEVLIFNSSSAYTPHVMGKIVASSISPNSPAIVNAQIPISSPFPATVFPDFAPPPPGSAGMGTGFMFSAASPIHGGTPAGNLPVNSGESHIRVTEVNSAANPNVPAASSGSGLGDDDWMC